MKISNKLFNEQQISQFSKQMETAQKIQAKISSGKNIIFACDEFGNFRVPGVRMDRLGSFSGEF
mgnify:CR=1 FL=1